MNRTTGEALGLVTGMWAAAWALVATAHAQEPRFVQSGFYPASGPHLIVQDLDHDGLVDLLTAGIQGFRTKIWLGDGTGGFSAGPAADIAYCIDLAAGGLNGDALDDLVCKIDGGAVRVGLSAAAGYLPGFSLEPTDFWSGVEVRDCNLDGYMDIAEGNGGWFGNGAGQFVRAGSCLPLGGVISDVNGDGLPDHLRADPVIFWDWYLVIGFGQAGGGFGDWAIGPQVPAQSWVLAVGDLTSDGAKDVLLKSPGQVGLSLGAGDGSFAAPVFQAQATSLFEGFIGSFGEGFPEAAILDFTYRRLRLLRASPAGALSESFAFDLPGQPYALGVGDFDRNGVLDLAVFDRIAGGVWIYLARRPVIEIPTLSITGLVSLTVIVAALACVALRRRRPA